jgi:outer membrane lipoprotein-sorting protein
MTRNFPMGRLCVTLLACLAAFCACFAGAPRRADAQTHWTLEGVLNQLNKESKSFQSLKGDIEHTKVTVVVNDKSTESGQIFVRRDDKMRIEFAQPDPRTILRTGNQVFLYNPKIKRVEEYDLGKHQTEVDQFLLLGFGTSGTEMEKGYKIDFLGEEELDKRPVLKLDLTPRSADVLKQITKVTIWIDEQNWLPAQQQVFEAGSQDYLLIHYTNVERNAHLSDNEFKPHWPKGVQHVKPEG